MFCYIVLIAIPALLCFNYIMPGSQELQPLGSISPSEVPVPWAETAPKTTHPREVAVGPAATARHLDPGLQVQFTEVQGTHNKQKDMGPCQVSRFKTKSSIGGESKPTTESHLLLTAHPTVTKPTSLFKPSTNLLLLHFAAEHEQQTSCDGWTTDEVAELVFTHKLVKP